MKKRQVSNTFMKKWFVVMMERRLKKFDNINKII